MFGGMFGVGAECPVFCFGVCLNWAKLGFLAWCFKSCFARIADCGILAFSAKREKWGCGDFGGGAEMEVCGERE